jgi:hypothetical protein
MTARCLKVLLMALMVLTGAGTASAASVLFSNYTATGVADTSWVITDPSAASINMAGADTSYGGVNWEGTTTNGHGAGETYATVGPFSVYYSVPGVSWATIFDGFYPTSPSISLFNDGGYGGDALQIDIAGLTIGQEYVAKFVLADSRAGIGVEGRTVTFSAIGGSTGSSSSAQYAYTDGQYLVVSAAWTADATTHSFNNTLSGGAGSQLNGVQVYAVPEPATLGLVGAAALGLLVHRRRRVSAEA